MNGSAGIESGGLVCVCVCVCALSSQLFDLFLWNPPPIGHVVSRSNSFYVHVLVRTPIRICVRAALSAGGKKGGGWKGGGGGVALTENQQMQIQAIEERDADFDRQLDEIGEGIADLGEIAALQGEEVQAQSAMLDNLK